MLMICLSCIQDECDRQFFEKLYRQYADDLFKRVYDKLKNQADTEDVMQNTWLCVMEHMDFYKTKEEASIKAYILRIAEYQAAALYRKRMKKTIHECEIKEEILSEDENEESMLFRICDQMDAKYIAQIMKSLAEKYRDVLTLYYLYEHPVKEIAEILGLSISAVKSRLLRGRKMLRDRLEGRK